MEEGGGKSGDKGVARVKLSARIVCEMELPSRFFSSGTRNCSSQKANLIRFPCIRPITRPTPERQRIGNLWRYILFSVPPPLISPTEERDRRREITMDRVIVRMILRKFFFFSFFFSSKSLEFLRFKKNWRDMGLFMEFWEIFPVNSMENKL